MVKKNPAAVTLGKRGGRARAKKLSAKQRKEIARLGGLARQRKGKEREGKGDVEGLPKA